MKFLTSQDVTRKARSLLRSRGPLKMAIAYWGKDALKLLRLNPRRDVELICCLKGGKSDPDVIKRFRRKARQHDKLHAKVIWTRKGAIVGSANASSNGLPQEEDQTGSLIEAGVFINSPETLAAIRTWFDRLYKKADPIAKSDLTAARVARSRLQWNSERPITRKTRVKPSLVDALLNGTPAEFQHQNIAFALYEDRISKKDDRSIRSYREKNAETLERRLLLSKGRLKRLEAYVDWKYIPASSVLIDCYRYKGRFSEICLTKTFHETVPWIIKGQRGEKMRVVYCLPAPIREFSYKFGVREKRLIRAAAKDLWRNRPESDGGILSLADAAPILRKYAAR